MSTPTAVMWCDIESTDSDPNTDHAAILEVAIILTDHTPELNPIATASLLVRPPGLQSDHDLMWSRMPQVVRDMHSTSGLWREATTSPEAWNLVDADRALRGWVAEQLGEDARVPLAGSGVGHLDRPWILRFMPQLATRLTYWHLDIGNVRRMLALAGRDDLVDLPTDVDAKPHRALGDVTMHVAEARRYLGLLGAIPRPEPVA